MKERKKERGNNFLVLSMPSIMKHFTTTLFIFYNILDEMSSNKSRCLPQLKVSKDNLYFWYGEEMKNLTFLL